MIIITAATPDITALNVEYCRAFAEEVGFFLSASTEAMIESTIVKNRMTAASEVAITNSGILSEIVYNFFYSCIALFRFSSSVPVSSLAS
jgi:hypothetical protein